MSTTPRRRCRPGAPPGEGTDRGSVTAYLLVTMVALFALAGLVLDGGAALAAHGRAADIAQQAARAGADALDETSLRSATPAGFTANPAAARSAADRVLTAAGVTGDVTRQRGQRHRHRPRHPTRRDLAMRRYHRGRRHRDRHRHRPCTEPPRERPDVTTTSWQPAPATGTQTSAAAARCDGHPARAPPDRRTRIGGPR